MAEMAKMYSPEKCPLGLVNMSHFNSVVRAPQFTKKFWPNVELVVVDDGIFRLST